MAGMGRLGRREKIPDLTEKYFHAAGLRTPPDLKIIAADGRWETVVKNDLWTTGAVAVSAMMAATVAHEALGHGGACLAMGGKVTLLTSVYFRCNPSGPWIDAGGPIGNLVAAVLALMILPLMKSGASRLFAALLFAFSASWFAGYAIYSFLLLKGDYVLALRGFLPHLTAEMPIRIAAVVGGLALYPISRKIVARYLTFASVQRLLFISWFAGTAAAMAAAAFFAPERLGAIKDGAFEIGLASVPLLLFRNGTDDDTVVVRSPLWIGVTALFYVVFVWLLGRGIS